MIRIILLVILIITFGIPLLNKAKDFWDEKSAKLKVIEQATKKAIRYNDGAN
jgi:hypothetical protein